MFKLLKKSSVIRESLVEVINKSGETKKEIARQINVSQQSLSDWTTLLNTKPVTLENAQALTDHFRDSDFTLQVIHEFFGLFKSIDGDVYRRDPSSLDKLQMIESDERKQKKQEVEKILLKQVNYLTVDDRQQMLGYKGYIQLAQRSGKYKALNVIEVYEGELKSWNRLTEEFDFDPNGRKSDEVIGYVGYFELLNGFKKTVYWTKQEIEAHRIANNKDRDKTKLSGVWASDYNAMARKTVLRNLLSKWGILSIEMQEATTSDERVQRVQEDGSIIAETEVEEDIPERKEAEVISEKNEDVQTGLFDASNPPLNK